MKKKKQYFDQYIGFKCTEEQKSMFVKKGIRAEDFRRFVKEYGETEEETKIKSSDWRRLKDIVIKVPSLQIIGAVGAGKSHLVRELILNDRDNHIYIVLDSHNGYDFLPKINQINPHITQSSVLELHKNDEAAGLSFKIYKSLIQQDVYPKNFILVVDEALRYKKYGIKNLLAESRKFLRVVAVTQERLCDFVPEIHVENYNAIRI